MSRSNRLPTYQQFFANGLASRNGIRAVVRDIDGDGKAEVVTSAAGGSASWLRVLSVTDSAVEALDALWPFGAPLRSRVSMWGDCLDPLKPGHLLPAAPRRT